MLKWLGGFILAGVVLVTGFQLIPVYMANHKLNKIVAEVVKDTSLKKRPKREVISALQGQFNAQDLSHLDPKEVVKVARDENGELVLDVKYEERRKLMYNLEIVAGFDEQFTN